MVNEAITREMALLAKWFGPIDADPQLTVIEIPEDWGSQASVASGIIQTADAFRDRA